MQVCFAPNPLAGRADRQFQAIAHSQNPQKGSGSPLPIGKYVLIWGKGKEPKELRSERTQHG